MTDMKWTTVKRKRKDPGSEEQRVSSMGDLSGGNSGVGKVTAGSVPEDSGYVRRQKPKSSMNPKAVTAEQQQLIQRLYVNLETIAKQVMTTKRSEKEAHEHALLEIRSLLDRIIIIDPSLFERPLGDTLENAITKIYTVVA